MARSAVARAEPRPGSTTHLIVVLLGFALAIASFVAASLYADARLARVAQRMHDFSDNAFPTLMALGTMRSELADIHLALHEASEGQSADWAVVDVHRRELDSARSAYEALPPFPGEPAAWGRARPKLDEVSRAVDRTLTELRAGSLPNAQAIVDRELVPAIADADASLLEVRLINLEQGNLAAVQVDRAWMHTRRVSLMFDVLCTVFTAGLAWLAFRSARIYAAAEGRRADELDAFAARVAHDIRGPLSAPLFALEWLGRDLAEGDSHKRAVERGIRSLQRVDGIVGDLLTFARAAAAPDGEERASLRNVITGVVQDAEREASKARVHIDVDDDLPACEVACAPGVLASIVGNLVANAIKFMPNEASARRVSIRATLLRGRVDVEVADTGAGLPADVQLHIFEPYVRADKHTPGLGLGLATVKRLVDAHGGKVGVRSRVGSGSVFWFEMPAAPSTCS
jgi:signal transduction histidine kinase